MNLLELQKLDFLLKKANNHGSNSNKHQIIFEMNGDIYTGDFIPKLIDMNVLIPDIEAFESDQEKVVSLKNKNEWKKIASSNNGSFDDSDLNKIITRSAHKKPLYYFHLVNEISEKYPVEFDTPLPNYIYNIKNLSKELPINIPVIKVSNEFKFDFISIVPIDEINQ